MGTDIGLGSTDAANPTVIDVLEASVNNGYVLADDLSNPLHFTFTATQRGSVRFDGLASNNLDGTSPFVQILVNYDYTRPAYVASFQDATVAVEIGDVITITALAVPAYDLGAGQITLGPTNLIVRVSDYADYPTIPTTTVETAPQNFYPATSYFGSHAMTNFAYDDAVEVSENFPGSVAWGDKGIDNTNWSNDDKSVAVAEILKEAHDTLRRGQSFVNHVYTEGPPILSDVVDADMQDVATHGSFQGVGLYISGTGKWFDGHGDSDHLGAYLWGFNIRVQFALVHMPLHQCLNQMYVPNTVDRPTTITKLEILTTDQGHPDSTDPNDAANVRRRAHTCWVPSVAGGADRFGAISSTVMRGLAAGPESLPEPLAIGDTIQDDGISERWVEVPLGLVNAALDAEDNGQPSGLVWTGVPDAAYEEEPEEIALAVTAMMTEQPRAVSGAVIDNYNPSTTMRYRITASGEIPGDPTFEDIDLWDLDEEEIPEVDIEDGAGRFMRTY